MEGQVVKFKKDNGYGFIECNGADYFFHVNQAIDQTSLRLGSTVEFDLEKGPDGRPRAVQVFVKNEPCQNQEIPTIPKVLENMASVPNGTNLHGEIVQLSNEIVMGLFLMRRS